MSSDIERTSLDAHVSLCELRYQALERRLTEVESQLDDLRTLLSEIRDTLAQLPNQQSQRWERVQWGIIGSLGAVAAWALATILRGHLGG